jgi:hypothetical protein
MTPLVPFRGETEKVGDTYVDRVLANLDAAHERGDVSTADYIAAERSILDEANLREANQ